MRREPRGHEAPIGAAEHAGARRVDVGPRRDRVEQRHQVVGVDRAEPALDGARMRLAIAGRAARVRQHHGVARRIDLRLVEQLILELPVRPAMDQQQHRMRSGAGRRHQPAVHRIAVRRGGADLGHRAQAGQAFAKSVSFVSTPSRSAITSPALVASVTHGRDHVAGAIIVGHAAPPADQLLRGAARADRHEADRAAVERRAEHVIRGYDQRPRAAVVEVDRLGVGDARRLAARERNAPERDVAAARIIPVRPEIADADEVDAAVRRGGRQVDGGAGARDLTRLLRPARSRRCPAPRRDRGVVPRGRGEQMSRRATTRPNARTRRRCSCVVLPERSVTNTCDGVFTV